RAGARGAARRHRGASRRHGTPDVPVAHRDRTCDHACVACDVMAALRFIWAMAASVLPSRHWDRVPPDLPIERGAFASGVLTWMIGLAIGVPGFLAHAHGTTSLGIDAMLHRTFTDAAAGYSQGMVQGFSGLSIFTFLLLTPAGWLTLYLVGTGGVRA